MAIDDARRPEDVVELIVRSWNARDADGLGALFDDDGEWVTPYGDTMVGPSEIAAGHRVVFERFFADAELASI